MCALQVFIRKVIELHDKYLAYVNDCFQNHTLFHKVCIRNWLPGFHDHTRVPLHLNIMCSIVGTQGGFLRSSATRVLLEAQVQNYLQLFVIIFLRKVEVRN